ncbi:Na(+)/H(+) exchanger beta-like [Saccostrea echinata]|uniref:Na(+)/H(+) exchanger beta-like n=1 Tax=Saccostrea echinata TaxID=191078 RepID=UPI002A823A4B|nr:Na(+)/H(+) exchanger beta-like [Saccostrea echinata]
MTCFLRIILLCGVLSLVLASEAPSTGNKTEKEHASIHLATIKFDYVKQPLIIAVFIFAAGIAKLAFHHAEFISSRVPESCLLIILGIIVGAIMSQTESANCKQPELEGNASELAGVSVEHREPRQAISMTSSLFFLCLLPPIILESAYSLHDRTFFENVGSVIIFAVIGTVLNCFLIGPTLYAASSLGGMGSLHLGLKPCLVFSAIIVAVDPVAVLAIFQEVGVNNVLYFLVFGESLFNDAVTVVLYNMMQEFNKMETVPPIEVVKGLVSFFIVSLGGLFIGIFFGVLTAIITKYTSTVRVVEPLAVFVLAYISYLVAELFHFSGIIGLIGCGLTQAHYAFHNISQKSLTTITYFSKMQSALSDCIIFLFLGIGLFNCEIMNLSHWRWELILWTLFLCLLYRFLVVFCLTWIINRSNRMRKIQNVEKFIMAYGGLRGAVAFSLVDLLSHEEFKQNKDIFMTTCLALIFFTVFVQGISIKPLVRLLQIKLQEEQDLKLVEEINTHVIDHVMAGIEEILGEHGENYFREIIEYYNRKFFKVWLMKEPVSMDEQIMSCFEEIALQQHFENLQGSAMINSKYGNLDFPWLHQEESNDAEEESEGEISDGSDDLVLPAVTVRQPLAPDKLPTGYWDEENDRLKNFLESKRKQPGMKRKSIVPAFLRKPEISQDPTAQELKNIFTPSYRDVQHRKLDKNLKDDSSTNLLRYLQDKQFRNRRMSRAVFKGSKSNSPFGSNKALHHRGVVENYKRRLSLAVPERPKFVRGRSPSDVTNLRGVNLDNFIDGNSLLPDPRLRPIKLEDNPDKHYIKNETHRKSPDHIHEENEKPLKRYDKGSPKGEKAHKRPLLSQTKSIFTSISEEDHTEEEEEGENVQSKVTERLNGGQGHSGSDPDLLQRHDSSGQHTSGIRKSSYNKAMSDPTSETVELKSYKKKDQ